ncbi:MAG: pyruvate dehydrogenase (acetyl-transferring) E1 component subunit alpha [Gemmatimonas sp.]|jgi:pyruvate dehydrogenase E1 component alpha subunit|uniref:pyruvate dehydrogenase (acetyl-transferring) E1 component subunit alpha n=1 Tax=Gemmatimonas sp. TaxID=1962908 RepID=UPI0022BE0CA6|nr:pyruvate dehydrogenase (acetyl-transferring) E1 component subunit alpha [Gemmatimonas sp.]MCA2983176.1 pyruvate dehydrogenase (acetyl-transferring) E1 component subunit alpha [Gemmatimonas sp.]MCA2995623.1 pyruvate dehydrogenase (acetyl-transferring) E1 component subunit alpha [Gemmatimonas sp.]MCE2954682.1 pyruvate dehydrogenase (acetyl-transferring) E1 component subunit alpha [Gemmatimonas sp.]MCZ8012959.1 pyruvate dehydrogenase (acetyl-transferring) E1 component subunit alpha [Gemmatimona
MPPKKKSDTQVTVKTDSTAALHKELLYSMLLQRRFEERCAEMYAIGRIGGFCHLYIGQEAVSTGFISLLRPDDYIITTYRDHGQALARGMTPRAVMSELFGRQDGCAKGKGGSMHMFDRQLGFLGGHGIVGGHVPIASGVGFAIRYRGGDQVIACFMGESVVNTGAFHEALNMAALWKLPCIFIIENNRYGMGTALERASSIHDIYKRGASYDMPRDVVDGQDVLAVRKAAADAIDRARKESMPTLLEVRTYRFMGHSMSDAVSGTYRTKEELEQYLKRDPIALHRQRMEDAGEISAADVAAMDDEIKTLVQDSIDFAEASPELPLEALMEDILVETTS